MRPGGGWRRACARRRGGRQRTGRRSGRHAPCRVGVRPAVTKRFRRVRLALRSGESCRLTLRARRFRTRTGGCAAGVRRAVVLTPTRRGRRLPRSGAHGCSPCGSSAATRSATSPPARAACAWSENGEGRSGATLLVVPPPLQRILRASSVSRRREARRPCPAGRSKGASASRPRAVGQMSSGRDSGSLGRNPDSAGRGRRGGRGRPGRWARGCRVARLGACRAARAGRRDGAVPRRPRAGRRPGHASRRTAAMRGRRRRRRRSGTSQVRISDLTRTRSARHPKPPRPRAGLDPPPHKPADPDPPRSYAANPPRSYPANCPRSSATNRPLTEPKYAAAWSL